MSEQDEIRIEQPTEEQPAASAAVSLPARVKAHRRIRYAAPLGFLVLLLALIGVIAIVTTVIGWIAKAQDDTPLREELHTFLNPVMQFCPTEFESVSKAEDADGLLTAAIYRVTEAERIRQLREKDESCAYPLDDTRMVIPKQVIEESYRALYGETALLHRSVGEVAEFNTANQCYYVSRDIPTAGYVPVLGKITRKDQTYTVQVAYVSDADIQYDARGKALDPTVEMAKYSQLYTVRKNANGSWTLLAVAADKK